MKTLYYISILILLTVSQFVSGVPSTDYCWATHLAPQSPLKQNDSFFLIGWEKSRIDLFLQTMKATDKDRLLGEIDSYIHKKGMQNVNPEIRYAFFLLLRYPAQMKSYKFLDSLSPAIKKYLGILFQSEPDFPDGSFLFSRIVIAIFSGMIEDGQFVEFCEEIQNNSFTPLKGAPNLVLIDSERSDGYPGEGLYRIASFLSLIGIQSRIVTAGEIKTGRLPDFQFYPHIIGKRFLSATLESDLKVMRQMQELYPESLCVAGGQEVSATGRIFDLSPNLYAGFSGWGELSMLDMVVGISVEGNQISNVPAESYMDIVGGMRVKNKLMKRKRSYTIMDFRVLFQAFNPKLLITHQEPTAKVYIHSSSHCEEKCTFCMGKSAFTSGTACPQKVLSVTANDVISRLQRLDRYLPQLKDIEFSDDNFLIPFSRAREFFDQVEIAGFHKRFRFHLETRLNNLSRIPEDLLQRMALLSTRSVTIGLESTLLKVVENLKKGKSVYQVFPRYLEILKKAQDAGFQKIYCFIILFTEMETMDETIDIIRDLVDLICVHRINVIIAEGLAVFPGTDLFQRWERGELKAVEESLKNSEGNIVRVPSLVLPKDPDNNQYIKNLATGRGLDPKTQYLIRTEYMELDQAVTKMIKDPERREFVREGLFKLQSIHKHLMNIAQYFFVRRSTALKVVSELRYKRDCWLEMLLNEERTFTVFHEERSDTEKNFVSIAA